MLTGGELLGEVLKQLQTDDIKTILENEKVELGIERNGNNIVGWLEKEIKLFNNSVNEDFSGRHNDLKLADIRISQGKTIKDSIGKLFNLPEWLKKILDVLNELLSLIKGAA